jgi:BirA family biotin operon repressor/biotin-[acetyl-CoA-carboxylase] ligase
MKRRGCFFNKNQFLLNLKEQGIDAKVYFYQITDSTQERLKELSDKDISKLTIAIAQRQSKGYGRFYRDWHSGKGGLWFSFIFKPKISPIKSLQLPFIICLALNKVLKTKFKIKTQIKWINDILYENKKLAGIIIENSIEGNKLNNVICGIGLNVFNKLPKDLQESAISLNEIMPLNINLSLIAALFLKEFLKYYEIFFKEGLARLKNEYNENIAYKNKQVSLEYENDIICGINKGIDKKGFIRIKTDKGIKIFSAGKLRLVKI